MRRLLLAAGALLAVTAAAAPAHAVTDPTGDFLPTFVGAQDADLDVTAFTVVFDEVAAAFDMHATLAGDIDPSQPGLYAIGVNTGTGVIAPFADIGNANVIFNQVVAVQKNGAAAVGANPLTALISGDSFTITVPLALLPSTGFTPLQYGFNLWPRIGFASNNQVSDFAPDNATMTASIPEPGTWAMMIAGFGLVGGLLRRRDLRTAVPV